jgi:hypothetical protein
LGFGRRTLTITSQAFPLHRFTGQFINDRVEADYVWHKDELNWQLHLSNGSRLSGTGRRGSTQSVSADTRALSRGSQ